MSDTQWLTDLESLRRLPQRYARAVDEGDMGALASLFHTEAHIDGSRGPQSLDRYLATMAEPRAFEASQHVLADPLIELDPGADSASIDTYGVAHSWKAADGSDGSMSVGVRYFDTAVRTGDQWLIRRRRTQILWMR